MKIRLLLLSLSVVVGSMIQLKAAQPERKSEERYPERTYIRSLPRELQEELKKFQESAETRELMLKTAEEVTKAVQSKVKGYAGWGSDAEKKVIFHELEWGILRQIIDKPPFNDPFLATLLFYEVFKNLQQTLTTEAPYLFEPGLKSHKTRFEELIMSVARQLIGLKAADNLQEMILKERAAAQKKNGG